MRVVSFLVQTTEDGPEQLGRRERKKVETQRAIRTAALTLALEQGVEHFTVAQVSELADIAPRTFFNYFSCKEDALVGDGSITAADLRERIPDRPGPEAPLDTLRAVLVASPLVAAMEADREQMLLRQQLIQDHLALRSRQLAQLATVERALADGLAARMGVDPDHDLRPELLASLALGVLRVAIRRWAADGSRPLGDLVATGFDLLQDESLTDALSGRGPKGDQRA